MLVNKLRHVHILDVLKTEPMALVRDLAENFEVSESTIRRDLEELEARGLLRRVHGGAFLESELEREPPFELRQVSHQVEKDLIGQLAAEWVKDGEIIFIDGGTTTQFIVPYLLERRNLTVVTCGLNITSALSNSPQISTISTGGELHVESQSFAGPIALEALNAYGIRCDKAFISTGGVSAEYGVTNRILDRIPLKRKAMEISRQVAVVADGSKLGVATLGHVAPIEAFHFLFTDKSAPAAEIAAIAARGVEVRVAG
jgi:DeoR/GlpR family transcriptional regulator of sugar metabolism